MPAIRPLPITVNQAPAPATPAAPTITLTIPATTASSGSGSNKKTPTIFQQVFGIDPASAVFIGVGVILVVVGLVILLGPAMIESQRQAGEMQDKIIDKAVSTGSKVAGAAAAAA